MTAFHPLAYHHWSPEWTVASSASVPRRQISVTLATSSRAAPNEQRAVSLTGKQLTLTSAEIKEFRSSLTGSLLVASNDG